MFRPGFIRPMKGVFYPGYVKRLHGTHIKSAPTKADMVEQVRDDIRTALRTAATTGDRPPPTLSRPAPASQRVWPARSGWAASPGRSRPG